MCVSDLKLIWKVTRRGYCVGNIKGISSIHSGNHDFKSCNFVCFVLPFLFSSRRINISLLASHGSDLAITDVIYKSNAKFTENSDRIGLQKPHPPLNLWALYGTHQYNGQYCFCKSICKNFLQVYYYSIYNYWYTILYEIFIRLPYSGC